MIYTSHPFWCSLFLITWTGVSRVCILYITVTCSLLPVFRMLVFIIELNIIHAYNLCTHSGIRLYIPTSVLIKRRYTYNVPVIMYVCVLIFGRRPQVVPPPLASQCTYFRFSLCILYSITTVYHSRPIV